MRISIIFGLILIGIITCINPIYPREQFLQHLGTIILMIPLIIDLRKKDLTKASFIGLSLFIMIHILGARYIYSFVPYNEWVKSIFIFDLNSTFHLTRNHYDRFVHFSFGILVFPYIVQQVKRFSGLNLYGAVFITWMTIQTFSMIYELFEWSLTIIMTENLAENYNGQQGDIWDAQKDMFLAMLGSTLIGIFFMFKRKKYKNSAQ